MDGALNRKFDRTLDGTLEGTLDGKLDETQTLDDKLDSSLNRTFDRAMDGTLERIQDGKLDGTLDGTLDRIFRGPLDATLVGTLDWKLNYLPKGHWIDVYHSSIIKKKLPKGPYFKTLAVGPNSLTIAENTFAPGLS